MVVDYNLNIGLNFKASKELLKMATVKDAQKAADAGLAGASGRREAESLVMYDTPILVSTQKKKDNLPGVKSGSGPQQQRAEDFLNSILPPKEFTDSNGKLWVRYVSPTPATKVEVLNLKNNLDKRLVTGQARDVGICPIRESLFQQCFDELIR